MLWRLHCWLGAVAQSRPGCGCGVWAAGRAVVPCKHTALSTFVRSHCCRAALTGYPKAIHCGLIRRVTLHKDVRQIVKYTGSMHATEQLGRMGGGFWEVVTGGQTLSLVASVLPAQSAAAPVGRPGWLLCRCKHCVRHEAFGERFWCSYGSSHVGRGVRALFATLVFVHLAVALTACIRPPCVVRLAATCICLIELCVTRSGFGVSLSVAALAHTCCRLPKSACAVPPRSVANRQPDNLTLCAAPATAL